MRTDGRRSYKHRMTRLLEILLWAYVAGLLLWVLARGLSGDQWLAVLLLSQMGPWLFLPSLFFAVWVLLSRQFLGGLLLAIPAGLFLWHYGATLLPPRAAPEPASPLTVVTLNLQATNHDVAALVRSLQLSAPDVAALQEVHEWQHGALSAALADQYPHRWRDGTAGLALYSIYPIVDRRMYQVLAPPGAGPIWPIQSAVLQIGEARVHLINAHLARTGILPLLGRLDADPMREFAGARTAQVETIGRAIAERGLPAIVACDGNMTSLTAAYAAMTDHLHDAWQERGWGFGHTLLIPRSFEIESPVNVAVQRIDYVFSSRDVRAIRVRVISHDGGSDHRPVWVEFDLHATSAH